MIKNEAIYLIDILEKKRYIYLTGLRNDTECNLYWKNANQNHTELYCAPAGWLSPVPGRLCAEGDPQTLGISM